VNFTESSRVGKSLCRPPGVCPVLPTGLRGGLCCSSGGGRELWRPGGSEWVIAAGGINCCKLSTGAILKCHLSDLAKVQTQTAVEFAINSNKMLRFASDSSLYLKTESIGYTTV
jgi:hypothetical protein